MKDILLWTGTEGPDHILSSDPKEMRELVEQETKHLSLEVLPKPAAIEIQQINKQRKSYTQKNLLGRVKCYH